MKITKTQLKQIIMEELENYYSVLKVNKGQPTGDASAIKKAYRSQAMANHPDRGGDPEKMKKVNGAKDVLLNPGNKQKYDQELYKDTMDCKEEPYHADAKFCSSTGISLDDKFLARFAELAGVKPAEGSAESEPVEGSPASKMASAQAKLKMVDYRNKILQGIQKRFLDSMKQDKREQAQVFLKLYDEVRQISDPTKLANYDNFINI